MKNLSIDTPHSMLAIQVTTQDDMSALKAKICDHMRLFHDGKEVKDCSDIENAEIVRCVFNYGRTAINEETNSDIIWKEDLNDSMLLFGPPCASWRSLEECGIVHESVVYVSYPIITINVILLSETNTNLQFDFKSGGTVTELKRLIQQKTNISNDNKIYLFKNDIKLINNRKLQQYYIGNNCNIRMLTDADAIGVGDIKVFMVTLTGTVIMQNCNLDDSVDAFSMNISSFCTTKQKLFISGTIMRVGSLLSDYPISDRCSVHLIPENMNVLFIRVGSKWHSLAVSNFTETVTSLKKRLEAKFGYPLEWQDLTFENEVMRNRRSLEYYNIKSDGTLILVLNKKQETVTKYIPIFVKDASGCITRIEATDDHTVACLVNSRIIFKKKGKPLNMRRSIGYYGFPDVNCTIEQDLEITVFVHTPDGLIHSVHLFKTDTISQLKGAIRLREDLLPDQEFKIFYKPIESDKLMATSKYDDISLHCISRGKIVVNFCEKTISLQMDCSHKVDEFRQMLSVKLGVGAEALVLSRNDEEYCFMELLDGRRLFDYDVYDEDEINATINQEKRKFVE